MVVVKSISSAMASSIIDTSQLTVAIGVIIDTENRVLMAKRSAKSLMAGFWEFPGGKVEPGECVFQALQRELREELNMFVVAARPWQILEVSANHGAHAGVLHFWRVTMFHGDIQGAEGQVVEWVPRLKLKELTYLPADAPIIEALLENLS